MPNHHLLFLLLLIPTVTSTTSRPPTSPTPPPQSVQDLLKIHHQKQLNNIIDALIGAGDFTGWANILSSTVPTFLPLSATLFIPSDHDFSSLTVLPATDPLIFPYHIVPQRLTFAQLHQLRPFSRLPTLLSNNSILVTNTSLSNFTLDGSWLSHPDLYTTKSYAVHGITRLLDYSLYGDPHKVEVVASPPPPPTPPPPPPPSVSSPQQGKKPLVAPKGGELTGGNVHKCNAAERGFGGCIFLVLIGFAVFGWVMQW